MTDMT